MKKHLITSILFVSVILAGGFVAQQQTRTHQQTEYVFADSKLMNDYATFAELEQDSDLIVLGNKGREKPIFSADSENIPIDFRTLSDVTLEKIYRNELKSDLKPGDKIVVQENAVIDGNKYYSQDGYQLMNKGESYLLCLRESLTDKGHYIIKGVYYGKISTNKDDVQYLGRKQVKEKLMEIESDALNKYMK